VTKFHANCLYQFESQDETCMWAQHSTDLDMTSKILSAVRRLLLIAEDETEK